MREKLPNSAVSGLQCWAFKNERLDSLDQLDQPRIKVMDRPGKGKIKLGDTYIKQGHLLEWNDAFKQ